MRRLSNILVTTIITLVMIEAILRIILAIRIGPDLLLYGTPYSKTVIGEDWQKGVAQDEFYEKKHNVASHENIQKNYSKYFPGQQRSDTDEHGAVFHVRINNHGFRGRDYTDQKPTDVLRVACLGDSSTFGYGNREDQTYPMYLENELNANISSVADGRFKSTEAINFGIPHMLMENMYSMFIHEVLPIQPDVVTIYAGMFDAGQMIDRYIYQKVQERTKNPQAVTVAQLLEVLFRQDLPDHVLGVKLFNTIFKVERRRGFAPEHVEESFRYGNREEFMKYLSRIKQLCDKHGITFFVMTQQAQSEFFNEKYEGNITYQEEIQRIERRVEKGGITKGELRLLHHNRLVKDVRQWAADHNVPLIDAHAALDPHRKYIWHWVHILPEGNRILAKEMAGRIIEEYQKK